MAVPAKNYYFLLINIIFVAGLPAIERSANDLLEMNPNSELDTSLTCQGPEVVTCDVARVNWNVVNNKENIILPTGDVLMYKFVLESVHTSNSNNTIALTHDDISAVYENTDGCKGVLTFTTNSKTIYGIFELGERTFVVESLNTEGSVVWVEIDQSQFEDIEPKIDDAQEDVKDTTRTELMLARGREDRSTIVEYSITVYYTKEFKEATTDPITFIDQVIAETNQGYINSNIPIRAKLHCVLESDIADGQKADVTLVKFKRSQNSLHQVRRSADASILLVNSFSNSGVCGVNYFNTLGSGNTIGTVRKGCALGYYSFGHEVAHGFGLAHDRRVASQSSTNYAFGFVFRPRMYRTIMAYSTAGEKRMNYYSSSEVSYQGYDTGNKNNDNARTLTEVRFAAANIGDENMSCPRPESEEVCEDKYRNCPQVAVTSCWHPTVKEACRSSCGLCPGMVEALSNTCYNKYSNCDQLAALGFCSNEKVMSGCKYACGGC